MNTKVIKTLNEISKSDWNSLVSCEDVQMSYDFLCAVEQSKILDYSYYYILVYDNNELIAAIPICITSNFYLDIGLFGALKNVSNFIRKFIPSFLKKRVLFCGCCVSEYNKLSIKANTNKEQVIREALNEIDNLGKKEKVDIIIFKDFVENFDSFDKDYIQVCSLPGTYLDIEWDSFENYLKSLKRKYRKNIQNRLNKINKKEDLSFEVIDDYTGIIDRLYYLYESTFSNATVKFEKFEKDYFYNLKNKEEFTTSALVAKKENEIIGFILMINSEHSCIGTRIGLDYRYAHEYQLYFMLIYQIIQYSIDNNYSRLYMSQTAYRPKLELGAKLMTLYLYTKHTNKFLNKFYQKVFCYFFKNYRTLTESENPHHTLKDLFPQYFIN